MSLCLMVSDPTTPNTAVEARLTEAGHVLLRAQGGPATLRLLRSQQRLVVVFARASADVSVSLCRELREVAPTVAIVALGESDDDAIGSAMLAAGADVFLPANCVLALVVAAVEALLRRVSDTRANKTWPDRVTVNDLDLDLARGAAYFGGRHVDLTPSEFRILRHLAVNAGRVVPNDVLGRAALGHVHDPRESTDTLKVHIRHIREKIEPDSSRPVYVLNVRGVGYMLETGRRARRATERVLKSGNKCPLPRVKSLTAQA